MIPEPTTRSVKVSGEGESSQFGIDLASQVHLVRGLRSYIYTNKVLAVLREYSCNAWDAHQESGQGDRPIKVVLPTELENSLIIRDYGPGLSPQDMFTVFTQYGASTKRTSNVGVGKFGLGCKSAFSYSESFTVTSYHGGWRRVYHAILDEEDLGRMMLMHEEQLKPNADGTFDTGLEVKVPVLCTDLWKFRTEAQRLYRHFKPHPNLNLDLDLSLKYTHLSESGFLREPHHSRGSEEWVAVMGCVPYQLEVSALQKEMTEQGLWGMVTYLSGGLFFEIGEVDIVLSRERLDHTKRTIQAVMTRLECLAEEAAEECDKIVESTQSDFDRRIQLREFTRKTGIPIPRRHQQWSSDSHSVQLYEKGFLRGSQGEVLTHPDGTPQRKGPQHFSLRSVLSASFLHREDPYVPLRSNLRLLVHDTNRPLRLCIEKGCRDMLVVPRKGSSINAVMQELNSLLRQKRLKGVKIDLISNLSRISKPTNRKHTSKLFKLNLNRGRRSKVASDYWNIVDRTPSEEDVFFLIKRFETTTVPLGFFWTRMQDDKAALKLLDVPFPEIYGYKITARKPLTIEDCKGTEYTAWLRGALTEALSSRPDIQRKVQNYWWRHRHPRRSLDSNLIGFLEQRLPSDHPLIQYCQRALDAWEEGNNSSSALLTISRRVQNSLSEGRSQLLSLYEKYPLLIPDSLGGRAGLDVILEEGSLRDSWITYIQLIDQHHQNLSRKIT